MRQISNILTLCFIIFWMVFVFFDYWQKHPIYYYSFKLFQYWDLVFVLALIGGGTIWAVLKYGKNKQLQRMLNGISIGILSLAVSMISAGFAYGKLIKSTDFGLTHAAQLLGKIGGSMLAVYLIILVAYVSGDLFLKKVLSVKLKNADQTVIHIATGIMVVVMTMFLLGAASILYWFILIPLFLLLLILGKSSTLLFFKKSLLRPIKIDKNISVVGALGFYLLVVIWSINFTASNTPVPPGFDALTLYANLPSLIGQHHALVEGFQPYNWSLFMSLGHVLFGSSLVSMSLSYIGGLLAAYALYVLCRSWLKMDVNYAMLTVLVFSVTPAVTVQSFAELKIDLGLLFIYLSILLVALNFLQSLFNKDKSASSNWDRPALILLSLLSGFAMGIKLTTLFFAIALTCAFWYTQLKTKGFFTAFLFNMALVFLFKIDDFSGLRQFHSGVEILQWGLLLAALVLILGLYVEDKEKLMQNIRINLIYGLFFVIPFLPWIIKNAYETKSFTLERLINGKQASPTINLELLENNSQSQ